MSNDNNSISLIITAFSNIDSQIIAALVTGMIYLIGTCFTIFIFFNKKAREDKDQYFSISKIKLEYIYNPLYINYCKSNNKNFIISENAKLVETIYKYTYLFDTPLDSNVLELLLKAMELEKKIKIISQVDNRQSKEYQEKHQIIFDTLQYLISKQYNALKRTYSSAYKNIEKKYFSRKLHDNIQQLLISSLIATVFLTAIFLVGSAIYAFVNYLGKELFNILFKDAQGDLYIIIFGNFFILILVAITYTLTCAVIFIIVNIPKLLKKFLGLFLSNEIVPEDGTYISFLSPVKRSEFLYQDQLFPCVPISKKTLKSHILWKKETK